MNFTHMTFPKTAKPAAFLAIALAAFLVLSFAAIAEASTFSITGKVVAIDRHNETLTLDSAPYYGPNGRYVSTFALDKHASVMLGNEAKEFRDIRIGDWVIVSFHEESGGAIVADGVAFTSQPLGIEPAAGMFTLYGKIVAIDRTANTLTLVPAPSYGPHFSVKRMFVVESGAWVMMGSERRDLRDLRAGDWVMVNFRLENSGLTVARGIAITYPPLPYLEERAQLNSLTGKVVAVDRDAKTLAVTPSYCEPGLGIAAGARYFSLKPGTTILMGNEMKDIRDIRIGDVVTINYHMEANGLVITDGIAITFPPILTCLEERG